MVRVILPRFFRDFFPKERLKYQPDGMDADYLVSVGELINAVSENPREDRLEFAKRLVFNYAIGNSDAHLKNSAFLYSQDWTVRRLSPLYDVTCIPLTGYSTKMPFAIGRHRHLDEIDEHDIMSIALDLDVGLDDFDVAVRAVMKGLSCPDVSGHDEGTTRMIGRVLDDSAKRMRVLGDFIGL